MPGIFTVFCITSVLLALRFEASAQLLNCSIRNADNKEPVIQKPGQEEVVIIRASTPRVDRLVQEGLKLTRCCSQHICALLRSAILTDDLLVHTGSARPILIGDVLTQNL